MCDIIATSEYLAYSEFGILNNLIASLVIQQISLSTMNLLGQEQVFRIYKRWGDMETCFDTFFDDSFRD
jgi:hypothetical protein